MPGQRQKNLLRSRRRVEDEGEDDGAGTGAAPIDSQSEASDLTDNEGDGDADDSELSDAEMRVPPAVQPVIVDGSTGESTKPTDGKTFNTDVSKENNAASTKIADAEAMMNGLSLGDVPLAQEPLDFEAVGDQAAGNKDKVKQTDKSLRTPLERRRMEDEEYKKKRDSDPAFIPVRGAFFMHDQRSAGNGHISGMRSSGRGRGRGRPIGGPFSPANLLPHGPAPSNDPWKHDLHESLNEVAKPSLPRPITTAMQRNSPAAASRSTLPDRSAPIAHNFSSTKQIGKVHIRILLPNAKSPVLFSEIPVKQYTRLPNHRPPLRRDKPVRLSLPDHPVRYIFPPTDRSFIFIPRAQRPNQQFTRGRGRQFGSIGGYSSRRTSVFGGSVYSPSVGMSRRSSLAGQFHREGVISPAGSVARTHGQHDPHRPVVRLPPGAQQSYDYAVPFHPATLSGASTPMVGMPPAQSYPLPQTPFRESWTGSIPMHQPSPRKNVSVSGIESPGSLGVHAPQQQEQQPFHQQVPRHMHIANSEDVLQHSRQGSFVGQPSSGTPLSNIPEAAIHAQPFQPFQQAGLHGQTYAPPPAYYYPPTVAGGVQAQFAGPIMAPMVLPGQPAPFVFPAVVPPAAPAAMPAQPGAAEQASLVPYEMNGMVYYYDQAQQYPSQPGDAFTAAPAGYGMPGMGGMMSAGTDATYFYPQVAQGVVYYPAQ